MERHNGKNFWVCDKCLTITHNNKKCPKCGHTHLRDIRICNYAGKNNQNFRLEIGE